MFEPRVKIDDTRAALAETSLTTRPDLSAAFAGAGGGERLHAVLACLYAFTLPLQTAPKEIAFVALIVVTLARLGRTVRSYKSISGDRMALLLAAWAVWTAVSLAWSTDPEHGLAELKAFRFLLTGFVLWPVLHYAVWFVIAFLLGILVQNGVQLGQGLEVFGLVPGANRRLDGLTGPIMLGLVCGMALCWHLAAALTTRGALRWLSAVACVIAGLGLVFTGSRGTWLATAAVLPIQLLVMTVRRPPLRRPVMLLTIVGVVVAVASWPVTRPLVMQRVEQAVKDLEAARSGGYGTDVGFRLLSWQTGLRMVREHPLIGEGVGAFYEEAPLARDASRSIGAGHAHSVYVHILACTGLVGLGLFLAIAVVSVIRAFRRDDTISPWAPGLPYVLLVWYTAAAFDSFHVSGQTFAVLLLLITLASPSPPDAADTAAGSRPA